MIPNEGEATEIPQFLVALELQQDEALQRAAQSHFAVKLAAELEALHFKQQREGLSEPEAVRCAELIGAYERAMLIRAQAVAFLKSRGIEITALAALP